MTANMGRLTRCVSWLLTLPLTFAFEMITDPKFKIGHKSKLELINQLAYLLGS